VALALRCDRSDGDLQSSVVGTVVDLPYDGTSAHPGYSVVPPSGGAPPPGAPVPNAIVYVGPPIVSGSTPPPVPAAARRGGSCRSRTRRRHEPDARVLHDDPERAGVRVDGGRDERPRGFRRRSRSFDEAALEAARYWSGFMQRNAYFAHCIPASACTPGDTTRAPATYGPQDVDPNHRFRYERGFSGALEAENIAAGFPSWQSVESAFMPERESCPNGSAATCPFSDATGHFLNIVDADYAWSAGAIVAPAASAAYDDQEFTAIGSATAGTNGFARGRFVAGSSSHE
jgi:hypothetical protein